MSWRADHRAVLDEILETPDDLTRQVRDLHGVDVGGEHWRRTVVAEADGRPVGVATVYASRWHPARLWLGVEVAPAERRCGVGTTLFTAAKDAAHFAGVPLRGKVFADSPGAFFAGAMGLRLLQRSRTFRLPEPIAGDDSGFLIDAGAAPDAVASAFLQFYIRTHTWDPPGDIQIPDVRRSHVDEAAATLLVGEPGGAVLAVGCLYDEPDGLLLSGGATGDDDRSGPAAGTLLEASAALAEKLGRDLLVEADDAAPELIDALGARGGIVLDEVHIVSEA